MKSEQIQVQGEYEVNVESEPVIITEASTPDRHDTQMAEAVGIGTDVIEE